MYSNTTNNASQAQNPFMIQKEDEIDLKVILFNYLQYWPIIVVSMFLGILAAFLFNRYATPVYKVESTILVVDDKPTLGTDLFESAGLGMQGKSNIENEIGILKSYSLAEETVRRLDLNVAYYREDFLKKVEIYDNSPVYVKANWTKPQLVGGLFRLEVINETSFELRVEENTFQIYNPSDPFYKRGVEDFSLKKSVYSFGTPITDEFFDFTVDKTSAMPGDIVFFKLVDTPSLALRMKSNLSAVPLNKQASILTLSLETPIRRFGEEYINKLMEMYLLRELSEKNRASENTVKFIGQQLSGITDSLQFSENRLQQYRTENRTFNLSEEGTVIFQRLQELERERSETELNLKYYQTLQQYLNNNQLGDLMVPSTFGNTDLLLSNLVQQLSEMQAERVRLTANFSDQTPQVRDINTRILNVSNTLKENVNSAIRNVQSVLADLNNRIKLIEQDINLLPETERNLLGIQRQFAINESIYIYLLQKKAEAEITKAANMPKNSVLDYAKAGQYPIEPKKTTNLLIGMILGLILPIGFITVKDFLNTKIEDPKELESQIKVPLIGMIGRSTSDDNLPVLNNPRSTVTESFRSLRADMSYLSPNKNKLAILFTSSISGEGKTFVSINMASVFALMGKKTILIGLDLRKPKIAEDFNLPNDRGMSTCLSSDVPWQEVVKSSGHQDLDVILSGPIPPNPAELLLQDKFGEIVREIKAAYDVVVFDCPPVGLVSETKELFGYSDINFFVFRQGYSMKGNTHILNNLVEKGGISKIYGILNDVHIDKGYGYSYGYGYGYGNNTYGYHEEVELPWWKRALKRK